MQFSLMTDRAILGEIAGRVRRGRLNQNITQSRLAQNAGVGRSVVQNLENGQDVTLTSLLRVLRTLGLIDQLNAFLPDPGVSPVQLARMQGRERQRASGDVRKQAGGPGTSTVTKAQGRERRRGRGKTKSHGRAEAPTSRTPPLGDQPGGAAGLQSHGRRRGGR